jgi:hypothetical protein
MTIEPLLKINSEVGNPCACTVPDSNWIPAGSFLTLDDCNAAISMAQVILTDASGMTSTNDCSQTAQCIVGPPPQ